MVLTELRSHRGHFMQLDICDPAGGNVTAGLFAASVLLLQWGTLALLLSLCTHSCQSQIQASLIHANAFTENHVLQITHFTHCMLIPMFETFDLQVLCKVKWVKCSFWHCYWSSNETSAAHVHSAIVKRICKGLPRWSVIKCSTVFHTLLSWPQGH